MADLELEINDVVPSGPPSPASPDIIDDNVMEGRPRKKGRQRLLRGLQRIPSLPSLTQLGRFKPRSRQYGLPGSLSCVSLSTNQSPFAQAGERSYVEPTLTDDFPTTPISRPATSAAKSSGYDGIETLLKVRKVQSAMSMSPTIALPSEVKIKKARVQHMGPPAA